MAKLSTARVKSLKESGRYADGQVSGLYLNIAKTGSKSFVQRIVVDEKRKDVGLGGFPTVSLATAREWATENRSLVVRGNAPLSAKDRRKASRSVPVSKRYVPTVRDIATAAYEQAIQLNRWTHEKNRRAWPTRYYRHVDPKLGDLPVDKVSKYDVRDLLTGILSATPETGKAVKDMLNLIFDHAVWLGMVQVNPVGEIPNGQLPDTPPQQNMKALPHCEVAGALNTIDKSDAYMASKLAIRFLALTAVRSRSVRLATWDQVDLEARIWTIPEMAMKSREEFRVPLSTQAVDVLRVAGTLESDTDLVFPNQRRAARPMSDSAFSKLFRELEIPATPHGLRTSFREWAEVIARADFAVAETALAHVVGNKVTRAYLRGDYLSERRLLMQQWGHYVDSDMHS